MILTEELFADEVNEIANKAYVLYMSGENDTYRLKKIFVDTFKGKYKTKENMEEKLKFIGNINLKISLESQGSNFGTESMIGQNIEIILYERVIMSLFPDEDIRNGEIKDTLKEEIKHAIDDIRSGGKRKNLLKKKNKFLLDNLAGLSYATNQREFENNVLKIIEKAKEDPQFFKKILSYDDLYRYLYADDEMMMSIIENLDVKEVSNFYYDLKRRTLKRLYAEMEKEKINQRRFAFLKESRDGEPGELNRTSASKRFAQFNFENHKFLKEKID